MPLLAMQFYRFACYDRFDCVPIWRGGKEQKSMICLIIDGCRL